MRTLSAFGIALITISFWSSAGHTQPMGKAKGMGKGPPAEMRADQEIFHFLLENHKAIRRTVKRLDNGVETLTESDKPEVALKIQEHVASMHKRVKEGRGLRFWDELFVAIFKNYKKIEMKVENTKKGVRVIETSDDPFTARLIQAHADVVSRFVEFGFNEAHKNHPVSTKDDSKAPVKLVYPIIPEVGGVLPLPKAGDQPRKGAKIVLDLTGESKPSEVHKGLLRAALILNLYGAAGLQPSDVKIAIVLHGKATRCALTHEAYKLHTSADQNPNLAIIAALQKVGVEVAVCGQALNYSGFKPSEIPDTLPVSLSAVLFLLNRHEQGFLAVPVP
jgi:intracellular sulfur oxidation DsrE/DsrF family protein